ncbi:hypothetical protein [Photobacterium nomapromontoriensis]|uniref:hypothetical protein n=1 Tax=Photobacterium nomapromontoriensis TaxID=2910237 RepID=UPI003D118831
MAPLEINGIIGKQGVCKTLLRIAYFKKHFCKIKSPDSVISVNGITHKKMQELSKQKDLVSNKLPSIICHSPTAIVWPLKKNYI